MEELPPTHFLSTFPQAALSVTSRTSSKSKRPPSFDDIAAYELTLWHVSITEDGDGDLPILLDDISSQNRKKLRVTHKLTGIFNQEPAKRMIHILVQRPAPVHVPAPAPAPTRLSGSPLDYSPLVGQKKSVLSYHIESELVYILKQVSSHRITPPINPRDVEGAQREKLGPFYKRILPYHKSATDTRLVMLGLELDRQAKTSGGETLCSIVEGDIRDIDNSDFRVVAMVAPSGSGKTATVIDLASKHFVIYCVCCSPQATISLDFKDPNFIMLADDVQRIYRHVSQRRHETLSERLVMDMDVKRLVGERVQLECLARLLFLQLLLNNNAALEPKQFFREQTNGGASTISAIVRKLKEYGNSAIQNMLRVIQTKLRSLVPRKLGLVMALDEAQVASGILRDMLISPAGLTRGDVFDHKNKI